MSNRLNELMYRHRLASPASWLALLVVVLLLIWVASKWTWLFWQWQEPLPEAVPGMVQHATPTVPAASLSKWHLFGNAEPLQDNRALANAPNTQLQLTLLGVWAGKDPKTGRAMIANAEGVESSVATGREVVPGVILDQVLRDRVVLTRNGAPEVLRLRVDATNAPATTGNAPPTSANSSSNTAATSAFTAITLPTGDLSAPNLATQNIDMEAIRQQLGADPLAIAQSITAIPVMENGQVVGVRLHSGQYAGALAKLGLRGDDVVTSVNGVEVGDPARISGVLANLQNTRSLSVTVRRNGKTESLSIDLN